MWLGSIFHLITLIQCISSYIMSLPLFTVTWFHILSNYFHLMWLEFQILSHCFDSIWLPYYISLLWFNVFVFIFYQINFIQCDLFHISHYFYSMCLDFAFYLITWIHCDIPNFILFNVTWFYILSPNLFNAICFHILSYYFRLKWLDSIFISLLSFNGFVFTFYIITFIQCNFILSHYFHSMWLEFQILPYYFDWMWLDFIFYAITLIQCDFSYFISLLSFNMTWFHILFHYLESMWLESIFYILLSWNVFSHVL